MTRTLLTFGDSNTYGMQPMLSTSDCRRFGPEIRWPCVTAAMLGPDWALIEEGLPGRTTQFDDPVMGAHMNGRIGLRIALQSHGPIDMLTILLGTNDLKTRFQPTPATLVAGIAGLVDIALSGEVQARHDGFEVLVICPPPVLEQGPIAAEFRGAAAAGRAFSSLLKAYCEARPVHFFDADTVIGSSQQDGVHFDKDAHRALGEAIAAHITAL